MIVLKFLSSVRALNTQEYWTIGTPWIAVTLDVMARVRTIQLHSRLFIYQKEDEEMQKRNMSWRHL